MNPTDASPTARLRDLLEQIDGLGVEMGDEGAWESNGAGHIHCGQRLLKYANELRRIQGELEAALAAGPAAGAPEKSDGE